MHAVSSPDGPGKKDEKPASWVPDTCPMHHVGYRLSGKLMVRKWFKTEKWTCDSRQ